MSEKTLEAVADAPVKAADSTIAEIVKTIGNMSVLQLAELVKTLERHFGVTAAAPMMVSGPAPTAGAEAPAEAAEEKTEFDVVLESAGNQKIQVIKVVRSVTSLGLKEAKDLVEGAPKPVKEGISKEEAANIKAKLEEVGATVAVK